MLQLLRDAGTEVAPTSVADLEFGGVDADKVVVNDDAILSKRPDRVAGWVCIADEALALGDERVGTAPGEAGLQGEAFGQAGGAR